MVLIASASPLWKFPEETWKQIAIIIVVLGLVLALGSSYHPSFPELRKFIGEDFLLMDIPRFKDGERLEGSVTLVQLLKNKFGWKLNPLRNDILYDPGFDNVVKWVVIFVVLIGSTILFRLILAKGFSVSGKPFVEILLLSIFVVSIVFASHDFFISALDFSACDDDVINGYELVGSEIREVIPAGSAVFWDVKSEMLLLYLPDIEVFMPQLNHRFTLVDAPQADRDQLLKFGWWNYDLGEEWISQADYIVVENRFYDDLWEWNDRVEQGEFEVILHSSNPESCRADLSSVVVLRRVPVMNP
jgi:hypothetical protein